MTFPYDRGGITMTYLKHISEELELVLILSSVLFLVSAVMIASVNIISFIL